jgi:ribosomal protein S18 acetylase RimI-like enzyme
VPGVEVYETERTLRVATRVPSPLFNPVLRITAAAGEEPEAVEEAQAWFRRRGIPWSWYVGPATGPGDLAAELERRGFPKVTEPPGMAAPIAGLDELDRGADVSLARVSDERDVGAWFDVFAAAFGLSRPAAKAFQDLLLAAGLDDSAPVRHYMALDRGGVVATGSLVPAAGVAGLYNIATRTDRRGRGIGRAMTHALMVEGAALGYEVAILWSTAAGLPVYRRLGFAERVRIPTYLGIDG